jgi:hypothetical protein
LNLFVCKSRVYNGKGIFIKRRFKMQARENQIQTSDLGLLIFVVVAGWLLLFQSGLFY